MAETFAVSHSLSLSVARKVDSYNVQVIVALANMQIFNEITKFRRRKAYSIFKSGLKKNIWKKNFVSCVCIWLVGGVFYFPLSIVNVYLYVYVTVFAASA